METVEIVKHVSDPVHGPIGLTQLEVDVVGTKAFQRLRGVLHLGLAHLVFPSANFNRFSHSIGACHVAGRVLQALAARYKSLSHREVQLYRLAALCHDIGHYPFSHATEVALKSATYDASGLLVAHDKQNAMDQQDDTVPMKEDENFFSHEELGKQILTHDRELHDVLSRYDYSPEEIAKVFRREDPNSKLKNLISSDLDVDRLDYLSRTAHHTGLPYARVDLDYLVGQMRVDGDDNICLTRQALRAVDHTLVGRYFDYQQVAFHKTVAGLEELLKHAITKLVELKELDGSRRKVLEMIKSGEWSTFDDRHLMQLLQNSRAKGGNFHTDCVDAVIGRRPPKLIVGYERVGSRGSIDEQIYRHVCKTFSNLAKQLADSVGLETQRVFVWSARKALTKTPGFVSPGEAGAALEEDYAQSVRILEPTSGCSIPVNDLESSLMSTLSGTEVSLVRLYAVSEDQQKVRAMRHAARQDLADDLKPKSAYWVP